jgi:hypothetical protein
MQACSKGICNGKESGCSEKLYYTAALFYVYDYSTELNGTILFCLGQTDAFDTLCCTSSSSSRF